MEHLPLIPAAAAPLAPAWDAERWFGPATTLEALRGKVIALHAFQMLCPGCVVHGIPQAARIQDAFRPEDVAVIGLHSVFEHHMAMTPVSLAAFLHEYRVPFPVAVDKHGPGAVVPNTMARYQLRGTPSLVLIDRRGRLRANVFGRPGDLGVGAAIATLVAEASSVARWSEAAAAHAEGCDDEGCALPSLDTKGPGD